jgi:hypothetical protein
LIDHGHRWPEIQNYTRRQMALFFEEALHRERQARADFLNDVNLGMWGGEKINKRIRELRNK